MHIEARPADAGIDLTRRGEDYARRSTISERIEALLNEAAFLIDGLDDEEPDPDLEPSMGYVAPGHVDEAEGDRADDEDTGDELDASFPEGYRLTALASADPNEDAEDDDPDEHDGTAEPFLGALEVSPFAYGPEGRRQSGSQEQWGWSATSDLEIECEDEGAQCDDEGDSESDDDRNE